MVLLVIASLAVMTIIVVAFGGRGTSDKSRPNGMTERIPFDRQRRSPPQETSTFCPSVTDDDTLYDVEDFVSDYKITRLTKPNSKYYSLIYDDDDYDVSFERSETSEEK